MSRAGPSRYDQEGLLEQQNDEHLDQLHAKIRTLHSVTRDIHDDARGQNTLLDNTTATFDSFRTSLTNSAGRFSRTVSANKGQVRQIGYAVGAVAFLFFIWRFII